MALRNAFESLATEATLEEINAKTPALSNGMLPVLSTNIAQRIRSACESYPDTSFWEETALASGDFILARGNTGGAGWIEISKSPFNVDSETVLSVIEPIHMPIRINAMVSMTHRNAGQQIAQMEFVSNDAADGFALLDAPVPVEILDASQTTTTITINFATAPAVPFRIGQVVSVYGFVDTRLNVNSATVATVPTATQITLVGNDYGFTSTTIGTTLGSGAAFIERVDLLDRARNGVSIVHGNATVTNRRYYVRSQGGLARPSGTLAGSHQVSTGTDTATAAATGYDVDAWLPPLETVLLASRDGVYVQDRAPDANNVYTVRYRSTQIIPNPARTYKARFRVRSTPSLTRPMAKIVSVSKAGSTTATVTTDGPHGLTTGNFVGAYGVRDQTNFANLTTGAQCTVTGTNTFTVVWGASVTATSYGGFIMRVQGQQPLGGAIAQVAQSVSRTNNIVSLVGNATWAAPAVIGNIIQLHGCRDNTAGADLGLDGAYVVTNLATTTLTLTPVPGQAPTGGDITSTNCGGGVVQRLGFRIHAFMAVDYEPLLMEPTFKGNTDPGEAQMINGSVGVSGTVTSNIGTGTLAAVTSANLGIPGTIADVASAALTTTATTAALTPTFGTSYQVNIPVTAVTGTTPTLDVGIEESDDAGTNWFRVYDFPRITATGIYRSPKLPLTGNRVRYVQTVAGTTPSFTRAINRLQNSDNPEMIRQRIDRSLASAQALNAVTPSLNVENCRRVQLLITAGTITTTAPALQLEGSDDNGVTWYAIGTPLTAVASSSVRAVTVDVNSQLIRARVSTAGSGASLTYVLLKGF
jgi:hypothetical protein